MEQEKSIKKDERARNWTFVVYPESAPQNWRDVIDDEHIEWVESPLHDKDLDANNEIKKPHWHILVLYDGKKSFEQVKVLTEKVNAPIPQKVSSAKGLVRYMVHLDNPEKTQYKQSDIISHGGVDILELLKMSSAMKSTIQREIIFYIDENNITEFKDIVDYASRNNEDWFNILMNYSTIAITNYVRSARHKAEKAAEEIVKVNTRTGEVVD
jgi:hypothetical protein